MSQARPTCRSVPGQDQGLLPRLVVVGFVLVACAAQTTALRLAPPQQQLAQQLGGNWARRLGAAGLAGVALTLCPFEAAHARNAASGMFVEAETAMQDTINSYKSAKQEWSQAKKLVDQQRSDFASSKASTQKTVADAAALEARFQTILTEGQALDAKVAADITAIQTLTAVKYQAAETAALPSSKTRPAYTASLFAGAADEAAVLAKSEALLQSLRDAEAASADTLKKLSATVADARAIVTVLEGVEGSVAAGVAQLERGVSPALQDIKLIEPSSSSSSSDGGSGSGSGSGGGEGGAAGAKLFALGARVVEAESGRAADSLRALGGVCKGLGSVGADEGRAAARLADVADKTAAWEKETRLGARAAGGAVKSQADKLRSLAAQAETVATRACDAAGSIEDKAAAAKKRANGNSRATAVGSLREVQGRLEVAERRAKDTEQLISAATAKGREEAAKYRKFIPVAVEGAGAGRSQK